MKNSIVKFDTIETDNYIVSDYTSRKLYNIYDLSVINDSSYIEYYQLQDNETIEQVSYKLYQTTQYWDTILYINIMDPLFSMVYDFDYSSTYAQEFIDYYNNNEYIKTLPVSYVDELVIKKTDELETEKEQKRTIKVIKPGKILDFMKIIRQQEII